MANDTKWREFFSQVIAQHIPVEVKLLHEALPLQCRCVWSPVANYIEGTAMGPYLFIYIEWIRSDEATKIQSAAATAGLECRVQDGVATVYGLKWTHQSRHSAG